MTFIESYQKHLNEIRLISMFSTFLIAVIAILEIGNNLWKQFYGDVPQQCRIIGFSIGFQTLIAIIFTLRFVLLWFQNPKFIWFSQLSWLLGWLSIYFYQLATSKYIYESFFTGNNSFCINDYYYLEIFVIASIPLSITLGFYFILSPTKQLLTLIFSFLSQK